MFDNNIVFKRPIYIVYRPYYFLGHNSMLIAGGSGFFWELDNHLFIAQLRVLLFVVLCFATRTYNGKAQ
jgi:hypothetical protein